MDVHSSDAAPGPPHILYGDPLPLRFLAEKVVLAPYPRPPPETQSERPSMDLVYSFWSYVGIVGDSTW